MALTETSPGADGRDRRQEMARALARGGMDDVHVLSRDTADKALSPKRREIVGVLKEQDVESVRELARMLDRDKGQVSRDLQVLAEVGIIHFESDGRAKAPRLSHDHVVVEPIV